MNEEGNVQDAEDDYMDKERDDLNEEFDEEDYIE